ncbi:uncharacterized protein LOC118421436 [Branchiostoma floridae]|uniref:Uncharacterized protein LOC118421436 n=1 Tax=Branchiostoma floridae TaxID=7739 RepID=A0A9J7LMR3_BRAFL|nr:uncharacterized protein LOC118421436 [Branchiostoma floridae]
MLLTSYSLRESSNLPLYLARISEIKAKVDRVSLRVVENKDLFTSLLQKGLPSLDLPTVEPSIPASTTTVAATTPCPNTDTETVSACERNILHLSCTCGKTIVIVDAIFGRTVGRSHTCYCWTCDTNCRARNSLFIVRSLCQGLQACNVLASEAIFGDPCAGTQKYLEVSYRCISESNVAIGKTATQSSMYKPFYEAGKAVDGVRGTNGALGSYQCNHTSRQYQPWWKVDLAGVYTVNRVSILNRGDCCGDRLRNVLVRVGPNLDIFQNDQCGETYTSTTPVNGEVIVVYCNPPMSGRYVSLELSRRTDYLSVCEVEVYAATAQAERSTVIPSISASSTTTEIATACERNAVQLSCTGRKTIMIVNANYGRTVGRSHTCYCWTCDTNCRARNSLFIVRSLCQGLQACNVLASEAIFGDPCFGTQKYLEASYRCISESNVAVGKSATQSSTHRYDPLYEAGKAVDGDRGTNGAEGSYQCTHTSRQYQPWWKVDLAGVYTVNRVSILNKGDCCGERLRNVLVRVGPNQDITQNDQCGETYPTTPVNGEVIVVYCNPPMSGRYVSIELSGRTDYLSVCEVEVFAEPG